jgi:hypothetical protein
MTLASVERVLWIASLIATAALLLRLWRERLIGLYRFLMLYLAWNAIGLLILLQVPRQSTLYGYVYFAVTAVEWVMYVLVTLDLVALITKSYPGLTTIGRVAVNIALIASTLVALYTATIDVSPGVNAAISRIYPVFQLVHRTVSVDVMLFLASILLFLLWFPVPLSRNIVSYAIGFMVVFASKFSILVVSSLSGYSSPALRALSVTHMAVVLSVLCYWVLKMNRANEQVDVVVGHSWNRTRERALIHQLESLNDTIARTTTKGGKR